MGNEPAIERICEFGGIVSGENKRIFLVVNEHSTKTEENGIVERVVPYDFTKIEEGKLFPADTVYNLAIRLNGKTERLSGPLPMSDMHQVEVPRYSPDEQEHIWETELTVRRAAVKFTYYVTNESDKDFKVVGDDIRSDGVKLFCIRPECDLHGITTAVAQHAFALVGLLNFILVSVGQFDKAHAVCSSLMGIIKGCFALNRMARRSVASSLCT